MSDHFTLARSDLHEAKRIKAPVRAASTANVAISSAPSAIDGVTLVSGNTILLKDQSTGSQNGIYTWTSAGAALTRRTDASASTDFLAGDEVYVSEGTVNGASHWTLTTTAAITLGTTTLTYTRNGATSGSVTSVAMTVPTGFSVTGSPVTTSGTLAVTESTQSANTVKAGPTTGAAATPAYRALVNADVPSPLTIAGELTASDFKPSGLTGATTATRYVGGTASAAPASGTFVTGDWIVTQAGSVYICTAGGSPGTWAQVSGGGSGAGTLAVNARLRIGSNQSIASATSTAILWDTEDTDSDNQHYTSAAALTGTVAKTASSASLVGTTTAFTTELSVGQVISVPGTANEVRVVTAIADNTHLTVNAVFTATASGQTAARVNSALAFRTAGFYWVESGILAASATWTVQIRLNGSTVIGESVAAGATTSPQVFAAQSFAQWDYVEVLVTQSSGGSVNVTADQRTYVACGVSGYAAAPYLQIQDQKTAGTAGGTFTSGSFQTRVLNTIVSDGIGIGSLSSNRFTLPAGTYRCRITGTAYAVNRHKARLQNITDATTTLVGSNGYTNSAGGASLSLSIIDGRFTITGSKAFEVQHRCETTGTSNGFGVESNFGVTEIYTDVEVWKES